MIKQTILKGTTAAIMLLACSGRMESQTTSDAVMMNPGELCFDVHYFNSQWDEYWEGDSLRDNGNIGTLTTHTVMTGFMLGLMKDVNLLAMLPYIKTSPSAGVVLGDQGFQDFAVFLKVKALEKNLGPGAIKLLASAGVAIPVGGYFPDNPFAIGLGCPDGIFRGIVHYDADMGIYGRVDGAFHLRGNVDMNRNYYYTTQGYYTEEVDMPDAMDYNATLGYITKNKHVKAEAVFSGLTTFGGFDIRRMDGGFPSNDMEAMRIGLNADYYDLFVKGLGIHLNSNYTLSGRNVGKSMMLGGGISYQFPVWKSKGETNSESTPKAN